MSESLTATYERGLLRLDRPIDLAEGTRVSIVVLVDSAQPEPQSSETNAHSPADLLAEVAKLATRSPQPTRDARDHDAILYGKDEAK